MFPSPIVLNFVTVGPSDAVIRQLWFERHRQYHIPYFLCFLVLSSFAGLPLLLLTCSDAHFASRGYCTSYYKKEENQHASFKELCTECGNPEALYRKGMKDFFKDEEPEVALEYVKRAANEGHMGALYVMGILFIFMVQEKRSNVNRKHKRNKGVRKEFKRNHKNYLMGEKSFSIGTKTHLLHHSTSTHSEKRMVD